MATTLSSNLMPLNAPGPLTNMAGKLSQLTNHHGADGRPTPDGSRKSDDAIAVLEALLRERDLIIGRQERVMRNRTMQLDVLCEELARVAAQLSEQQTSLEDRAQRLEQLEQTMAKYKNWLSGYDANMRYLEDQLTERDQTMRDLKAQVSQLTETVNRLAQ
jgi:DNA repair ATPase RecN